MKPTIPRVFSMIRKGDASGVSGTGRVLDGTVFHNGWTFIVWRTEEDHGESTFGFYPSFELFKKIHIDSHPENKTEIVWVGKLRSKNKMIDRGGIVEDRYPE